LRATCSADSSPVTYKTGVARDSDTRACKSKVDFPMPGSPPIRMTAPVTSPPPSTRSNSAMPVGWRGISRASISARLRMGLAPASGANRWFWAGAATVSVRVFHSPQCGHLPSHLGQLPPHSLHTKVVLALAILMATRQAAAAVHAQLLACDKACFSRQKESDGRRHICRLAQPAQRNRLEGRLLGLAAHGVGRAEQFGFDWAGRH